MYIYPHLPSITLVKIISIKPLLPPIPTIMRVSALLTTLFAAFACGDAFVAPVSRSASCVGRSVSGSALPKSSSLQMSAFDGIKGPVQSYVDIWTPMFKQASESGLVPDFLLQ
jgi:hypothetical protein